jgi:hypothetical protein
MSHESGRRRCALFKHRASISDKPCRRSQSRAVRLDFCPRMLTPTGARSLSASMIARSPTAWVSSIRWCRPMRRPFTKAKGQNIQRLSSRCSRSTILCCSGIFSTPTSLVGNGWSCGLDRKRPSRSRCVMSPGGGGPNFRTGFFQVLRRRGNLAKPLHGDLKELFEISGFWVRNRPLRSLAWLKELLYLGRNWSTALFRRCFTALTTPIYPAWLSRVICACVLNVV